MVGTAKPKPRFCYENPHRPRSTVQRMGFVGIVAQPRLHAGALLMMLVTRLLPTAPMSALPPIADID